MSVGDLPSPFFTSILMPAPIVGDVSWKKCKWGSGSFANFRFGSKADLVARLCIGMESVLPEYVIQKHGML
jgi:hypothetical protein